jgi:hypothetical protein
MVARIKATVISRIIPVERTAITCESPLLISSARSRLPINLVPWSIWPCPGFDLPCNFPRLLASVRTQFAASMHISTQNYLGSPRRRSTPTPTSGAHRATVNKSALLFHHIAESLPCCHLCRSPRPDTHSVHPARMDSVLPNVPESVT